ncbi:MAG: hypothetical protein BJ554DRAFT_6352 [Olpidium bornovanus]|uniref:Uncharacterized protein n=1 Tax=Olpidium bornovanus TaxID=278681 RepID=A0A8H8A265_9FUNG|nr:MAG: hypothetical protein BJ554DRAFT_6352 [Olpidium bornovanus]
MRRLELGEGGQSLVAELAEFTELRGEGFRIVQVEEHRRVLQRVRVRAELIDCGLLGQVHRLGSDLLEGKRIRVDRKLPW